MKARQFVVLALLALNLANCKKPEAGPPPAMPLTGVTVAPPVTKEVQEWDEFTGRIDALETVEVRPRVSGSLESVNFKSGQIVKKGDLLFTLDARPFQAVLDRAEAEVLRASTKLELSKMEADRAEKLIASHAISSEEADTKRMTFREANSALASAKATVKAAALDVEFCTLRSPIEGRVSRAMVTAGNYVSGVAGFTTLLTTVVTADSVYVYADVDEATFNKYQRLSTSGKGTHLTDKTTVAEMRLDGEEGYPHAGRIESFDNRIQGTTGSILVRAIFDNKYGSMRPGAFVRMRLPAGPPYKAMLVDEKAIGTAQGLKYVLTVDAKNMTEYKPVETGPLIEGHRVIRSGVASSDSIIVNGLAKVRPGMPVAPAAEKPAEKKVASRL
ncbi:MAG: rane protein [Verrucomicrobiaceae bacterium]|nr:rane protein [Verrucomicrobiaceae bacterium]